MTKFNQSTMHLERPISAHVVDLNHGKSIVDYFNQGLATLAQWRRNTEARRQLQSLSDVMLQDIGLNWADIQEETKRWFWEPIDYHGLEQKRSLNIQQSGLNR